MKCPYCGHPESKVIDSRPADENASIRRRRECLSCAKRFTTYETVESLPMVVIKKDGSRQSFDRQKVLRGMIRACEKRPVPLAELERIADEIEQELQSALEREITTAASCVSSCRRFSKAGMSPVKASPRSCTRHMRTTRPQSTSGNSSATSSAMSASRQLCSATLSCRPFDV